MNLNFESACPSWFGHLGIVYLYRLSAEEAADRLWRTEGRRALDYLKTKRGLSEDTIDAAQLGYISGEPREWNAIDGLKVPCRITIPWYAHGVVWGIKVRRASGEQRYQEVSGGNIKGCLYLADHIQPGLPLVLTEGEFDALIAWQAGKVKLSAAPAIDTSTRAGTAGC